MNFNMATMATTSQSLSVSVGSSDKNPMDSNIRQNASSDESHETDSSFAVSDLEPQADSSRNVSETEENGLAEGNFRSVSTTLEDVETRLKRLTDEQFYIKLRQLQEANRKTLEVCEELRKAENGMKAEHAWDVSRHGNSSTQHEVENSRPPFKNLQVNGWTGDEFGKEEVKVTAKPPPGPPKKRESNLSKSLPERNTVITVPSETSQVHHNSSFPRARHSHSLDDEEWHQAMQMPSSVKLRDDEMYSEGDVDPELLAAVSRIRNMWHDFRMDDYSKGQVQSSSASSPKKKKKKDRKPSEWRHKTTIPEPFQMSLREASKTEKKTRAQREMEYLHNQRQQEEEKECQKQFKARPAPAHIYKPLYNEIVEKKETRRCHIKQYSKDLLKIQQKPFNFIRREEEKKQSLIQSATLSNKNVHNPQKSKKAQKFVAQPLPDFIASNSPREKSLEEEEYRKKRIKKRAEEMLKKSSLPPNMASYQQLKEEREKEKLMKMKAKRKRRSRRRPRSSRRVPDYDTLHQEIQKELALRKDAKEATVVEPFYFQRTKGWRKTHEDVLQEIEREEKLTEELREATRAASHTDVHTDVSPVPLDRLLQSTTDLRVAYFRWLKEHEARKKEQEEETERRKRLREEKFQKYVAEFGDYMPRPESSVRDQRTSARESDSAYVEQYEKDLEELRERMEKRQLLLERELQLASGKAAGKTKKSSSKKAYFDEDLPWTHDRISSVHSGDSGDNLEMSPGINTTFTKSRCGDDDHAS